MPEFARRFPIELIDDQALDENPWFRAMLALWRPAGDALQQGASAHSCPARRAGMGEDDPARLRLAIRDNYMSLYRSGQSIAKIEFGADGNLQAGIHKKYVYGEDALGETYLTVTSAGLRSEDGLGIRKYGGAADLERWIANANANKSLSREKRFIDLVVARNPDTIDLEMGLPYDSDVPATVRAPRMDLVALESAGNRWRIVFWEAKLVNNSEARCRGEHVLPRVAGQLSRYTGWLRAPSHAKSVASAYQNTCRLLVKFHAIAKSIHPEIEELGMGIVAAAAEDAPGLLVDDKPRLLIDDREHDVAFERDGHLAKLRGEKCGIQVQMVGGIEDMRFEAGANA